MVIANPRHSVKTSNWYTPDYILEAARATLGTIDLDPCSSFEANQRVQADVYLTAEDNPVYQGFGGRVGLNTYYAARMPGHLKTNLDKPLSVFCNPPSPASLWWEKLMQEVDLGHIKHAIFLAYSIEAIQVTQRKAYRPIASYPVCFLNKRVAFIDGTTGKPKSGMTHSSALVYVPGTEDHSHTFELACVGLGAVMYPARYA